MTYLFPRWLCQSGLFLSAARTERIYVNITTFRIVSPDSDLFRAIRRGDLARIQEILVNGTGSIADICSPYGFSTLSMALLYNQTEIVHFLLRQGATQDIPENCRTYNDILDHFSYSSRISSEMGPFAVMEDYVRLYCMDWHHVGLQAYLTLNMLSCLNFSRIHNAVLGISTESVAQAAMYANDQINSTDSFGRTPLHWTAITANSSATSVLLQHGATATATDKIGATPLHLATSSNSVPCMRILLEQAGKEILEQRDGFGCTPIHWASQNCSHAALEFLLSNGANVNAQTDVGEHALYFASRGRDIKIVQLLENYGACRNLLDKLGFDAYLDAVFSDSEDILEYYLQDGPDLGGRLFNGSTILHVAARNSNLNIIKILSRNSLKGVDVDARDNAGFTAVDYARQRRDSDFEGKFLHLVRQMEEYDCKDSLEEHDCENEVYFDAQQIMEDSSLEGGIEAVKQSKKLNVR
jgi:ankyrin repeat protein